MVSHAEAVHAAIQSMQGTLQIAAALLQAGRQVDLAGLDGEAARICMAVGMLPDGDAAPLRPSLEALVSDIDRVTIALAPPAE